MNSRYRSSKGGRSATTAESYAVSLLFEPTPGPPALTLGAEGGADLGRTVREDRIRAAELAPGDGGIVVHCPHPHGAARGMDLLHELGVGRSPMRRVNVGAGLAHHPRRIDGPGAHQDAQLQLGLHFPQLADRRVMKRNHRAFRHCAELAQHRDQLLLEARVLDGHLLDLDDQADLADRQFDHLLQEWDVLALAGVEAAELSRGRVTHHAVPLVVRSRVWSWMTINLPSKERCTSHSIRSQPAVIADRNDRMVFSGLCAGLPRCPPRSGWPSS